MLQTPAIGTEQAVGLFGVGLDLVAYAMLQAGLIRGQSYTFILMNMIAAVCILFSLQEDFNLSSMAAELSWIAISVFGMVRLYIVTHRLRFTTEEERLLASKLPNMPRHLARRLLDAGLWTDDEPGAQLTTEGTPVMDLVYISDGKAAVEVEGRLVAHCRSDTLIGEITCMSGEPASATVRLSSPARCFRVPASRVRALAARDEDFRQSFEAGVMSDIRRKLDRANRVRAQG